MTAFRPYCAQEKGQIEYCNKLQRQEFPPKETITKFNTMDLKPIQMKINNKHGKNPGFGKPFEKFNNNIKHSVTFAACFHRFCFVYGEMVYDDILAI